MSGSALLRRMSHGLLMTVMRWHRLMARRYDLFIDQLFIVDSITSQQQQLAATGSIYFAYLLHRLIITEKILLLSKQN